MSKLCWNVFYHNFNQDEIQLVNIFDHGGFSKEVNENLKKHKEKDSFADELRRSLMYYFWSKCEWETVISPWVRRSDRTAIKVDVYWQVMANWEPFVDYIWKSKEAEL